MPEINGKGRHLRFVIVESPIIFWSLDCLPPDGSIRLLFTGGSGISVLLERVTLASAEPNTIECKPADFMVPRSKTCQEGCGDDGKLVWWHTPRKSIYMIMDYLGGHTMGDTHGDAPGLHQGTTRMTPQTASSTRFHAPCKFTPIANATMTTRTSNASISNIWRSVLSRFWIGSVCLG